MTPQRHFSFSFPEEMDDFIDFLFVRCLFLDILPSKNNKKSDIKIVGFTPQIRGYSNNSTVVWVVYIKKIEIQTMIRVKGCETPRQTGPHHNDLANRGPMINYRRFSYRQD